MKNKKSSDERRRRRQITAPSEINKSHDFFVQKEDFFASEDPESNKDIQPVKPSKRIKRVKQIECKFNTDIM
jgi:hypothetical protein